MLPVFDNYKHLCIFNYSCFSLCCYSFNLAAQLSNMPILFSVVARGTVVLAKYATCAGNFSEVTEQILSKIPPHDDKLTYSHGNYLFHYIAENKLVFFCITDDVSITPIPVIWNHKTRHVLLFNFLFRNSNVRERSYFSMKLNGDLRLRSATQLRQRYRMQWMVNLPVHLLQRWNITVIPRILTPYLEFMGN